MLQIKAVRPACLALLRELMDITELKSFRLAGGTALSLRLGHRVSIDLDLFTNERFDVHEFVIFLKDHFKERIQLFGTSRYGVFASIDGVKTDLLYCYEKFINKEDNFENLRMASLEDIGAMKIQSAASRGSKKDYHDLFELLNVYTFAELIGFFLKMYPNYDISGALRPMANFSESDLEEDPESIGSISWDIIKKRISAEIKEYVHTLKQDKLALELKRQKSIEEIISRKKGKN